MLKNNPFAHFVPDAKAKKAVSAEADANEQILTDFDKVEFSVDYHLSKAISFKVSIKRDPEGCCSIAFKPLLREGKPEQLQLDASQSKKLGAHLLRAGIDRWREDYEPPEEITVSDGYTWSIQVSKGEKSFSSRGSNACPKGMPKLCKYLELYGVPTIWSDEDEAPMYVNGDVS